METDITQQVDEGTIVYENIDIMKIITNGIYLDEDLDNLPENIKIFTLPVTTSIIGGTILIENIYKFFPLNKKDIHTIQTKDGIRTLQPTKKHLKNLESVTVFMNQMTIIMKIRNDSFSKQLKDVNIKLFDNNSIQITGLKSVFQCNYSINKLFRLLTGKFCVYIDKDTGLPTKNIKNNNCEFKKVQFINLDNEHNDEIYITDVKISTINISCKYSSKINQTHLFFKLQQLKLEKIIPDTTIISLQVDIISALTIWLIHPDGGNITIFVFESGKISLMACKNRSHILYAYNFIMNVLKTYHDDIIKKNLIDVVLDDNALKKLIDLNALKKVIDYY